MRHSAGEGSRQGYVPVTPAHIERLARVHVVSNAVRAILALSYESATSLDKGERDLYAHALERSAGGDSVWLLCSPDKASVRAAVELGWADQLGSLGGVIAELGSRPQKSLRSHHEEAWLNSYRTQFLLERKL